MITLADPGGGRGPMIVYASNAKVSVLVSLGSPQTHYFKHNFNRNRAKTCLNDVTSTVYT